MANAFGYPFVSHCLAWQVHDKYPNAQMCVTARNSFDRLFSCWKYDADSKASRISFENFILNKVVPGNYTWFGCDGCIRYVLDIKENNLISYYMNLATIQEDFDHLCDHIKIERKIIPVKNQTYAQDYRTAYNSKMIDHVSNVAKEEIDFFGWDFEDPKKCAPYFRQIIDLEKNNFTKKDRLTARV
jgi:hypothetical protein